MLFSSSILVSSVLSAKFHLFLLQSNFYPIRNPFANNPRRKKLYALTFEASPPSFSFPKYDMLKVVLM